MKATCVVFVTESAVTFPLLGSSGMPCTEVLKMLYLEHGYTECLKYGDLNDEKSKK